MTIYTNQGRLGEQSVEPLTLAQVMISCLVSSNSTLGCALRSWSLLWILCFPLFLPLPCSHSVSLTLSKINKIGRAHV